MHLFSTYPETHDSILFQYNVMRRLFYVRLLLLIIWWRIVKRIGCGRRNHWFKERSSIWLYRHHFTLQVFIPYAKIVLIFVKNLLSEITVFNLQIRAVSHTNSLIDALTSRETVKVVSIFLIVVRLWVVRAHFHLLQIHYVFYLLRSRRVMKLMLAATCILRLGWAWVLLALITLRIVGSGKLTVLIAAKDLHLACLCGDTAICWVQLRILLLQEILQRLLVIWLLVNITPIFTSVCVV